jgi:hypothetical protein
VALGLALLSITPVSLAAQDAPPVATPGEGVDVIVNGLTNPRGFVFGDDGSLYLALAGTGGEEPIVAEATPIPFFSGQTSSIVAVAEGCTTAVIEGLPSDYWANPGWTWGIFGCRGVQR